jgi:hypothetical protein
MPAIQPARLKTQAAQIGDLFQEPATLVRALHDLLDFYADRTRRPGKSGAPPPLLQAYQVPKPVMRQIWQEFKPHIDEAPQAGFVLADALWAENNLECRILAVQILGRLPVIPPDGVVRRLSSWVTEEADQSLQKLLLTTGAARLRQDAPDQVFRLSKTWLNSTDRYVPRLGLQILLPIIEDPEFDNLPFIYRLLRPLTLRLPSGERPYFLQAIKALAQRSPQETVFFLRENLTGRQDTELAALIRRSLNFFPDDLQASLRESLRSTGTS